MAEPPLGPIEQTPLRRQVAERLRTAIVTGRLRPGSPLTETALAEQLQVSRAPIREAIQDLENDGLVETLPYRGKRVKPLTVREVTEIREMRQRFEVMAVQRIGSRGAAVDELWGPCRAMAAAAERGDRDALIAADEAFHRTLIQLSDHRLLAQLWGGLYLRIHQIMALRNDRDVDLADIAAAHPPIVKALEAGDVECAVRLVSRHFDALADFDPASIADGAE
ncbi:MAG: GntR family transcriptional regulator [Gemmatimonadetes bacterium]|nr:GntR family transcriptional regulator [Gemmatimonadota bacterium]MBT8404858.1 GntR family transcriptional regulator [Gemmatimonadota bacterium]NNK62793.1 GntR family transcriptional regulator [Gemmatimonadota bacterium]